jgi:hypothetical protein
MRLRAIIIWLAMAAVAGAQTTVVGPVKTGFGTNWRGRIVITAPAITAPDGTITAPATQAYNVVDGVFSAQLYPNDALHPYVCAYYLPNSNTPAWTEKWVVPASSTPVTISVVRYAAPTPGSPAVAVIREKEENTFIPSDADPAAVQQDFTLSAPPVANTVVKVYKNGLLLTEGKDYTRPDLLHVSFLPGVSAVVPGDYVKLVYFY